MALNTKTLKNEGLPTLAYSVLTFGTNRQEKIRNKTRERYLKT